MSYFIVNFLNECLTKLWFFKSFNIHVQYNIHVTPSVENVVSEGDIILFCFEFTGINVNTNH